MKIFLQQFVSLTLAGLLFSACAIGPSYKRPDVDTGKTYLEPSPEGATIANLPWWDLFKDEHLKSLITEALANNQDLKSAVARIAQARATLTHTKADLFPQLSAEGSAYRSKASEQFPTTTAGVTQNDFLLGGKIFYEADLWGKLRRASESSRADLAASEEDRKTVTISLVSEVAASYFLLVSYDERLQIAHQTTQSRQDSLDLVTLRFKGGLVSELDVHQATIQLAVSSATIPFYERAVSQTENAISVLTGKKPGAIVREKPNSDDWLRLEIPAGLPSDLINRRPDILSSSERLHAQMARIGVAQAYRLPTINLTARGGFESNEFHDWFVTDAQYWDAGAALSMPLLDFGKTRSLSKFERAKTEEALQQYQKRVLEALREVEDGLVAVRTYKEEVDSINRQVAAAQAATKMSRMRYKGGVSSYMEVLEADRARFSAELLSANVRYNQLQSMVQLYKALGGGWTPPESK